MNEATARKFALEWNGHGYEKGETQKFWRTLLKNIFGVEEPDNICKYEVQVPQGFIDILIPSTKVLIEQKSLGVDLSKIARQADGEYLTPFEQAKRYAEALPFSMRPRWIVTCNFQEFRIYDLIQMNSLEYLSGDKIYTPTIIKLENFYNDFRKLKFIVDPNADIKPEVKISTDAAKIVQKICLAIDKNYFKLHDEQINTLSKLCARLVFCFYADDANLFDKIKFGDYLKHFSYNQLQDALQTLFRVLNTPENQREPLNDNLKNFPYVDGGLFEEILAIPKLNPNFKLVVDRAHILELRFNEFIRFSWREIDAPIFGAMFESILNKNQREYGIYYTTPENIHKVIDPLFMDDLRDEFKAAKNKQIKNRPQALRDLQNKIASLNFLDPACGSGNFLTETYLSLRELENDILAELKNIYALTDADSIKVTPRQFYGIEINDFAVAVAKVALSIAEIKMRRKTAWILNKNWSDLPLTKYTLIHKANALQVDWKKLAPNVDFIIGNPPFRGAREKSAEQAADIKKVFAGWKNIGNLDYVACWYKKSADFMKNNNVRAALVSTNSICQGDSVGTLWKNLFADGIHIDFAHRTFKWLSDSDNMAHVHCVVVGFSTAPNPKPRKIFDGDKIIEEKNNINAYLVYGDNIFVERRNNHLQDDVPKINKGNQPTDGGNLIIEANDLDYFLQYEPAAKKYVHLFLGAEEFIHCKKRYCMWLVGVPMDEIKKMPLVAERVENCRQCRLQSSKKKTREDAATPHLFQERRQPKTNYILVPSISSERRKYIPMDFMSPEIVASNLTLTIPDATLYHFGILTSSIHMAWLRAVGGRFKSDYIYSASVVYNNFVWCEPTPRQRRRIEQTAQEILNVRAGFQGWTYAKLYDEATMPQDLRDAHKENDLAVALAYGFEKILEDEAAIVAALMKLYKALTSG